MEDQYGMGDLRQYMSMSSRPIFPPVAAQPQPPDLLSSHRGLSHPYADMLIFRSSDSITNPTTTNAGGFSGFENGGGGGAGRWPRQETLSLLEIRSRLDPKFKEANQKGPLWDEVSRIMSEEHGYQRSGKKCREKFENLYKYYKKTKEGKAGRQDGKHYRFFRQLEALYGEANTSSSMSEANLAAYYTNKNDTPNCPKLSDTSLSLSNYSDAEADTSSSDGCDDPTGKTKKSGGWKGKIKDFIDGQMKKLMDKQELWMEKMMSTIEDKERERMMREEEWRKQDALRIEREHKFWANERAWIEARDVALMEALHKISSKESRGQEAMAAEIRSLSENNNDDGSETMTNTAKDIWPECEINRLIQLRTAVEGRFEERGVGEEVMWEEIATKMGCFGHDRSGMMCKEKWDSINNYVLKCSKKRKENSKNCNTYFHSHESISSQGGGGVNYTDNHHTNADHHHQISLSHDQGSSSPNPNNANAISESCFRYFMGDAYGRI